MIRPLLPVTGTIALYAAFDPRYAHSDPVVVGLALVGTALIAPCSVAVAYGIATRSTWRVPAQLMLSAAQVVANVVYWGTPFFVATLGGLRSRMLPWFLCYTLWAAWAVLPLCFAYTSCQRVIEDSKTVAGFSMAAQLEKHEGQEMTTERQLEKQRRAEISQRQAQKRAPHR